MCEYMEILVNREYADCHCEYQGSERVGAQTQILLLF